MRSEDFDREITIQRYELTRDEWGNPIEEWVDFLELFASKHDVSDTERYRSSEVGATLTTRFVVRWDEETMTINAKDRLLCDGLEYGIIGRKEVGRRQGIEISASARSDLFNPTPETQP